MIDFYPESKFRDSGRHKMINVEGYSAIRGGFVADESLVPYRGTFQKRLRRDAHMGIRTADVETPRS